MALFAFIYAAPIATVAITAFTKYTAFEPPGFAGLSNFKTIFSDADFLISIKNTIIWVFLQSALHVGIGLAVALTLRRKPKGWKLLRCAYLIPNIIPTAATGVMFMLLFNPNFGLINDIYTRLGVSDPVPNLFGNSKYAFWIVTATWIFYSAFNTIIFLSEISAIDPQLYEAASIDGATPWQMDVHITLPLLRDTIGTCVVLASVAMVSQFDIIYMTTKGGPGTTTLNLPIYLYKTAMLENNYGKANAVGVIQIILGITLVLLIRRLFRSRDKTNTGREESL